MFHCFEFRIIKKTLDKTSMQTVQMLLQSTAHTDILAAEILTYDTDSNSLGSAPVFDSFSCHLDVVVVLKILSHARAS